MKIKTNNLIIKSLAVVLGLLLISSNIYAQESNPKKNKKKRDSFIVYAGVNLNTLIMDETPFTSSADIGFDLGAAYKRGKFFYWQIGARYNNPTFYLEDAAKADTSSFSFDNAFAIRSIDVPITGGINFLAFIDRLAALRLYISAMPSFALSVGDNVHEITKDEVNSFNFYGQVGVGVDIAFFVIEVGWNYGFKDALKNDIKSNPSQVYFNLGARF